MGFVVLLLLVAEQDSRYVEDKSDQIQVLQQLIVCTAVESSAYLRLGMCFQVATLSFNLQSKFDGSHSSSKYLVHHFVFRRKTVQHRAHPSNRSKYRLVVAKTFFVLCVR